MNTPVVYQREEIGSAFVAMQEHPDVKGVSSSHIFLTDISMHNFAFVDIDSDSFVDLVALEYSETQCTSVAG